MLNPKIELLYVCAPLIRILGASADGRRKRQRIEQSRRISILEEKNSVGRSGGGAGYARLQQVVHEIRRIEAQHAFTALAHGVAVKDSVRATQRPTWRQGVSEAKARRPVIAIRMYQGAIVGASIFG